MWLLSPLLFGKNGGEIVNATYIKKALVESLLIFKLKKDRIVDPGLVSVLEWLSKSSTPPLFQSLCQWKASRQSSTALPPPDIPQQIFSLSKSEVRAGWPLIVSGQLQDELGMGMLTITRDEFAPTFRQWYEHCNKCIQIEDDFHKNWETYTFQTLNVIILLNYLGLLLIPPCTYVCVSVYSIHIIVIIVCGIFLVFARFFLSIAWRLYRKLKITKVPCWREPPTPPPPQTLSLTWKYYKSSIYGWEGELGDGLVLTVLSTHLL